MSVMDSLNSSSRGQLPTGDYAELTRRVRMAGGAQLAEPCEAAVIKFERVTAIPAGAREHEPVAGRARGNGCGRQRLLSVPYETPTYERRQGVLTPADTLERHDVVVCTDDDGVAFWPRFAGPQRKDN